MEDIEKVIFNRTSRLLGTEALSTIASKRVIIFGVGGVGSWCAESLIRSGIKNLTIVDSDRVALSNCNRQLMATTKTVGESKVEALKNRLLDINPNSNITALQMVYDKETAASFHLEEYDYVIDAIDSLKDKIQLIMHVTNINVNEEGSHYPILFSSMGSALRIDPTKITVTEFWKVRNDTLGAMLRTRLRQRTLMPGRKFLCVYSEELPMENRGEVCDETSALSSNNSAACPNWNAAKAQINGSLSHITGIFGLTLAGLVLSDIMKSNLNKN